MGSKVQNWSKIGSWNPDSKKVKLSEAVPLPAPSWSMSTPPAPATSAASSAPTGHLDLLKEVGRPPKIMEFALFEKVIADLAAFPAKAFFFHKDGEPLVNPRLNAKAKKLLYFRPYAPSVLVENWARWFDLAVSPHMPLEARVLLERRADVPGIVHYDGTSRPQTVTLQNNERYYRLIEAFHVRTGVPMLLNTSLNGLGKPLSTARWMPCCSYWDPKSM